MSEVDINIELHGQFGYQCVRIHPSQKLGTGSYGSVVKATLDDLPCAAKILHQVFFASDDSAVKDFAARFDQECTLLQVLKHPCIVQFLGLVQDPYNQRPILLMELMEESLTNFLECRSHPLPYYIQVNITHDITLALAYLHKNQVIHRDLSSNNVLVNAGSRAKVTDFGMSKVVDVNPHMSRNKATQCPGTPPYMSPEVLRTRPRYSDKLDTFSTGVLIIQIITHQFPDPTDAEMIMDDPTAPTGQKIILVPEIERRKNDISKVPSNHPLLPTAQHCLKDQDTDRPSSAVLCQRMAELEATSEYEESRRESQWQIAMLPETTATLKEKQKKVEELEQQVTLQKDQMRQLATFKEQELQAERKAWEKEVAELRQSKEREVAKLRQQIQSLQTTSTHPKVRGKRNTSQYRQSAYYLLSSLGVK